MGSLADNYSEGFFRGLGFRIFRGMLMVCSTEKSKDMLGLPGILLRSSLHDSYRQAGQGGTT